MFNMLLSVNALRKAGTDLGCDLRNEHSLDLGPVTAEQVHNWLVGNGFSESKMRKGRWFKKDIELIFDAASGFLYVPSV